MLMSDITVLLVVLIAMACGFLLGRVAKKNPLVSTYKLPWTQKRYVEGLTHLLNEQTDEQLDSFIAAVEVNSATLDVHLSLGGLLRRKGETSRAVKVHQNLLSRTSLAPAQLQLVQLELAKDYIYSGLLDRAETLLKELIEQNSIAEEVRREALERLIEVYQDTQDWLTAIDIADRLTTRKFSSQPDRWRKAQAHYACELAEAARRDKDCLETRKWIRNALRYDENCVRASLLQAQLDMDDNKYPAAIAVLKRVPKQDLSLASEMIMPLIECYRKLQSEDQLMAELEDYLERKNDLGALGYLCESLLRRGDWLEMLHTLERFLPAYPGQEATLELVRTLLRQGEDQAGLFEKFKCVIDKLIALQAKYVCRQCGFEGRHMHWLCPSCKNWASLALT